MTDKVTFDDLYTPGEIIQTTDLWDHWHYAEFLSMYDANFIKFKRGISLNEFKDAENYLKDFHLSHHQDHLKFRFPESFTFTTELHSYLSQEDYSIDTLELFVLDKKLFPKVSNEYAIVIQSVDIHNLADLLQLRFQLNKEHGEAYALRKNELIKEQVIKQRMTFLIAYDNGIPAGCLNLIEKEKTLEIDDLYVHKAFRHKKIASLLQEKTLQLSGSKQIILLADANDTPRNMYLKQGYYLLQTRHDIFKAL